MEIASIIEPIITVGSVIGAILAWTAKIQWSKEFREAKEAQISTLENNIKALQLAQEQRLKAKDEQIQTLNEKLKLLQDMTSEKTSQFFQFTKLTLEAYNNELSSKVKELEKAVEEKQQQIESLTPDQVEYQQKIEDLERQVSITQETIVDLETQRRTLDETLNSSGLTDISPSNDAESGQSFLSSVLGYSSSIGSALVSRPELALLAFLTCKSVFESKKEAN